MAKNLNIATANSWCYNDDPANCVTYGRLYTWDAAMSVCPTGWHLPSNEEWSQLANYLGGRDVAGGKLKETGIMHWEYPNESATNETCFSALPGGSRYDYGVFNSIGQFGGWWTSSYLIEDNLPSDQYVIRWLVSYKDKKLNAYQAIKQGGWSVRCVKD